MSDKARAAAWPCKNAKQRQKVRDLEFENCQPASESDWAQHPPGQEDPTHSHGTAHGEGKPHQVPSI